MTLLALAVISSACGSPDSNSRDETGTTPRVRSCDEQAFNGLAGPASYDGAAIVHFPLSDEFASGSAVEALFDLECHLAIAVEESGFGSYDGNEIGGGEFVVYLYGEDAEQLARSATDILRSYAFPAGSYLIVRQGEPGAPETRIDLQ